MGYGYPTQNAAPPNQIFWKPLNRAELEACLKFSRLGRIQVRIMAFIPLILIAINMLLLGNNYIVSIIALVFSIAVIAVSIAFIMFSRKANAALKTGMAIEIRAPAYRVQSQKNMPMYSVGPIMLPATQEVDRLIVQGNEAVIVCIPQLKVAITVNGVILVHGSVITSPANIEAMARPPQPITSVPQQVGYNQPYYPPPPPPEQ